MSLEGKIAIVTGSTSGIGLGIARTLADNGCSVILTGLGELSVIESLLQDFMSKYKGRTEFIDCDLKSVASIGEFCNKVSALYPDGIDILVNNAGIQYVAPIEEYPIEKWDEMMAVNLSAPFHLIRYFLPGMKKKEWGRIINIASQMWIISQQGKVPYTVSKGGLAAMSKGVALEAAAYGVTSNAICPSYVDSPIAQAQIEALRKKQRIATYEEAKKKFYDCHPTKKPVTIQQVADLVIFLCSSGADSMTGSPIVMDAGNTSQ